MNLADIIRSIILENGPIPFHDFMNLALYHEKYGYYRKSNFPAGGKGDFVTSPHTSRLFGALLANQLLEFQDILKERNFTILEMGAGSGYLAKDIIYSLLEAGMPASDVRYIIVEPFEQTKKIQQETLGKYSDTVTWYENIDYIKPFTGCLLSNELLDSFPVHVVQKEENGWLELYVDITGDSFSEVFFRLDRKIEPFIDKIPHDLPVPYRTEININMRRWIKDISRILKKGFILTIDYGYTHDQYFAPSRNRGTVLGYYSQNVIDDVLQHPGMIDITSHVNFSFLHQWGIESGFETVGYAPQYAFLGGLDFENTFKRIYGKVNPFSPEMAAVKMLIMPQGMGETHSVMVQSKGLKDEHISLSGFSFVNRVSTL